MSNSVAVDKIRRFRLIQDLLDLFQFFVYLGKSFYLPDFWEQPAFKRTHPIIVGPYGVLKMAL